MKKLALLLCAAMLMACANPYTKFYKGLDTAQNLPGYMQVNEPLKVFSSSDFKRDVVALAAKGYVVVGYSNFTAPSNQNSDGPMREQAAKLGAHAVLVSSKYSNTVSGAIPVVTPTTTTSYTTSTTTAYGRTGVVNAYGNSTTTSYGTQTNMIPYSVERSEFGAVFLAKVKGRLGVFVIALDDATRRRLETNQGVIVETVVEGSPAYLSDVIPGDVILKIGSDVVQSPEHFMKTLLQKYQGQTATLILDRGGKTVEKIITLN